ncbi:MAG TPA: 23S rRNA (adenine(2030)-N(6))-methyltransferase RlmJ [Geminicoccus sp.]|jgi:23S rRNA (adenine2030-N6)-methyltransferase|uniref:23S rRNA (adenine(2030)-N(6))-methyltransferase RlmJ n=1 Tax=Geminicoccus sp. TaxID=2024832 RepID=UPI002E369AF6|nr:23S rRNA (adenine(2030)-N(6))-methyltransferase RlmJ [Geminicoccus sp.]HEX2528463.1 23S rRNA (adenine(2030)-N(6))-methyltransferase RlmJ [Geminicoccus sp.]
MLSYRHGFHAGNHADVLKHAILHFGHRAIIAADPRPILVVDTHAGAGLYDLKSDMGEKVAEWRSGILPLLQTSREPPELLKDWLEGVRLDGPRAYAGSPEISRRLLRAHDRMVCFELHTTDFAALSSLLCTDPRIAVVKADGLGSLPTIFPPPERHALVLIDPSYEIKTDYGQVQDALLKAYRRLSTGTFMLWYPVIDRHFTERMLGGLKESEITRQYRIEFCIEPDEARRGMTGSGMLIINPPAGLPEAVEAALPWLAQELKATGTVRAAMVKA